MGKLDCIGTHSVINRPQKPLVKISALDCVEKRGARLSGFRTLQKVINKLAIAQIAVALKQSGLLDI